MTPDDVRRTALSFDGVEERDHHGFPSFRRRTIFATLPDETTVRIMLAEGDILAAVAELDRASEKWWGKRLTAVEVDLDAADPAVVAELLQDAWRAHS